jgi:hypothetical protein
VREYYTGIDDPVRAYMLNEHKNIELGFMLSANRIKNRKKEIANKGKWMLDSGAFTQIKDHGEFTISEDKYVDIIKRHEDSNLVCAVTQDYMCEQFILDITGKSVREHIRMTVQRYFNLLKKMRKAGCSTMLLPVLQGVDAEDYAECLSLYEEGWRRLERKYGFLYRFGGDEFTRPHRIGFGSMCKRNGNPGPVESILDQLEDRLRKFKIHLFGFKTTGLNIKWEIASRIESADSFAYSMRDRKYNAHEAPEINVRTNDSRAELAIEHGRKMARLVEKTQTTLNLNLDYGIMT